MYSFLSRFPTRTRIFDSTRPILRENISIFSRGVGNRSYLNSTPVQSPASMSSVFGLDYMHFFCYIVTGNVLHTNLNSKEILRKKKKTLRNVAQPMQFKYNKGSLTLTILSGFLLWTHWQSERCNACITKQNIRQDVE